MLTTLLKSRITIVFIATTCRSITSSFEGIGLIAIPISAASACALSIGNKVIFEINWQKHNLQNKMKKKQQTI